ncbi:MAG: hypothetical protein EOP08_13695, partial [Proteobacteria bacterium]
MKKTGRRFYRAGLVVAGLVAATAVAEIAFSVRDEHAFPHLNTYVADSKLGVRLRPAGRTMVRFGSKENPITRAEIGPEGYREPLPPPGADDVLVVGDSQVFGLGVEASETFSHVLAEQLRGKPGWSEAQVLNLGVPTYGPDEYLAVLEELLRTRRPRAIVVALNMVNDLFEASRPNAERHAVLDGWAVRKEHLIGTPWPIPYRYVLFGRSHLVYALRRQGEQGVLGAGVGVPSEGGYRDLLSAAADGVEAERRVAEAHALEIRDLSVEANRAYLAFER